MIVDAINQWEHWNSSYIIWENHFIMSIKDAQIEIKRLEAEYNSIKQIEASDETIREALLDSRIELLSEIVQLRGEMLSELTKRRK